MMKIKRKAKQKYRIDIARERIDRLLELAKDEFDKNPERSREYIKLARKIGMKYNVRLKKEQKQSFCKNCNHLLISKRSSNIEIDSKNKLKIIKCLNCGNIYRYNLTSEDNAA